MGSKRSTQYLIGIMIAAFIIAAFGAASAMAVTLQNGNFELPFVTVPTSPAVATYWTSYQRATNPTTVCSIQIASPPTGGGNQYQQIANTSASGGGGVRQHITGCTPGLTYTIAGWMRTNSTSWATAQVKVSPAESIDWSTAVALTPAAGTTSTAWVAFSGTVVATSTSMTIWLDGATGGTGQNKTACFDSITVVECTAPAAPTAPTSNSRCGTGTVAFGVTPAASCTTSWYAAATGGTSLSTANPWSPSISATTTYYASSVSTTCGESATRTACTGTVNSIPAAPTAPTSYSRCGTGTVAFGVTPAASCTVKWYAASTGGTSTIIVNPYSPSISATTTLYAASVSAAGCESATRTACTGTINPIPAAPTAATSNSQCGTAIFSFGVTPAASCTVKWYAASTGGTSTITVNPYSLSISATTTLYAASVNTSGCESAIRTACTGTVNANPVAPSSASVNRENFCTTDNGNITLTAIGGSGGTLTWYAGGCGSGASIGNGSSLAIASPATTTTYYVRTESTTGCGNSGCVSVTVNVKQPPTVASVGGTQTICNTGTTTSLGGNTPSVGTGTWSVVSGGTGTFSAGTSGSSTFTHLTGTGPVTLRWTISNAPCADSTADVVVSVNPLPTTASVGGAQTICIAGTTNGLGGNTPSVGTGAWSIETAGFTGTFNPDAATPNATWTSASGTGAVTLRWTISNSPCAVSAANVVVTVISVPTAPTGETATVDSTTQITWGWTSAGADIAYKGYNAPEGGNLMWTSSVNATSITESGLNANTMNERFVSSLSGTGCESPTRLAISVYTQANVPDAPVVNNQQATSLDVTPTAIVPVTEVAITIGGGGYTLGTNWLLENDGVISVGNVATDVGWRLVGIDGWATTTVLGLTAGTTYTFKVRARNGDFVETIDGPGVTGTPSSNCTPVSIITSPSNQNKCTPTPAEFTVVPGGRAPWVYQWQVDKNTSQFVACVESTDGTNVATATMTTVPTTGSMNGYRYRCYVTNCSGINATSAAATLTVNVTPSAPTAGSTPVCAGDTLNLTASYIPGATYAWTGPNGFTSNAQNPSITDATVAASGDYSVTATVGGCPSSAGTTSAAVNAPSEPPNGWIAWSWPPKLTWGWASAGTGITYRVYDAATGGNLKFECVDGSSCPVNANGDIYYTEDGLSANTYYERWITCTNSAGCVSPRFQGAAYTVAEVPTAPVVNNQHATTLDVNPATIIPEVTKLAITIGGGGTYTLTTHWVQADGSVSTIPFWQTDAAWGSTTVTGLTTGTTYTFKVRARNEISIETNDGPGATGTPTNCIPVSIATNPSNQDKCVSAKAAFTVVPGGSGPWVYQWQMSTDGSVSWTPVTDGTGGNSDTYTTVNTTLGMNGYQYQCVVSSTCGSSTATSQAAILTVNNVPTVPTSPSATPSIIKLGDDSILSATPGSGGDTVEWFSGSCGGTPVTSTTVSPGSTTTYYARTKNSTTGCVSATCASVTVTVDNTAPVASFTATENSGNVKIFTVGATTPVTIQGSVVITVTASDSPAGLRVTDPVTVTVGGSVTTSAVTGSAGVYSCTSTIGSDTENGAHEITITATDTVGNVTTLTDWIFVNKNQITGTVSTDFVGAGTRVVTFVINGGTTVTASVNSGGTYTLTNVPGSTISLSAKTAWTLRKNFTGINMALNDGQATAPFTLPGGDLNGTNSVNVNDYSILKANWLTSNAVADINGSGTVDDADYNIMKSNWFQVGD